MESDLKHRSVPYVYFEWEKVGRGRAWAVRQGRERKHEGGWASCAEGKAKSSTQCREEMEGDQEWTSQEEMEREEREEVALRRGAT